MEKTATSLRPVAALIEEFARAARQSGQYPLEHAVAVAAIERARQALLKLFPLASGEAVQLSSSPTGLLFNGQELPEMGPGQVWLNDGLRRRLVKTLSFAPGLEAADVIALIQLLAAEPEEILEQGTGQTWFTQKAITRIRAEEQDYRRLLRESETTLLDLVAGEKDAASQEIIKHCVKLLGAELTQASLGVSGVGSATPLAALTLPNLVALLQYVSSPPAAKEEATPLSNSPLAPDLTALAEMELSPVDFLAFGLANTIQTGFQTLAVNSADFLEWKNALRRQILNLAPETRARLFRAPLVTPGGRDALAELASELSPEVLIDQIVFALPDALVGETSSALERLFRRIMPSPEQQIKLEPLLRERFLGAGNSPEIYRNVAGLLLDNLAKEQMLKDDRPGYHLNLLSFEDTSPLSRSSGITDLLATVTPEAVASARSVMALDLWGMELSVAEYTALCNELATWAQYWMARNDGARAGELLLSLGREFRSGREGSYRLIAATALAPLATPNNAAWLSAQIPASPPENRTPLLEVLVRLGKPGVEELLDLAFTGRDDPLSQLAAGIACKTDASPSVIPHLDKPHFSLLNEGKQPSASLSPSRLLAKRLATGAAEESVRVIRLLLSDGCPMAISVIAGALHHPRPWVGIALFQALGESIAPGAGSLLRDGLASPRREFRLAAARALGKSAERLSPEDAQRVLVPLLHLAQTGGFSGQQLALRLEALQAVGRLKLEAALPALETLLLSRGWFFGKGRARVRFAAAGALAEIASDGARKILRQGQSHPHSGIAAACQAALEPPRREPGE
jgi:hypothetical protein